MGRLSTTECTYLPTYLYLSLNLVGLLFRSWMRSPPDLVTHELGFQLEVHLYGLVT